MKKIMGTLSVVLVVVFSFFLVSCGGQNNSGSKVVDPVTKPIEPSGNEDTPSPEKESSSFHVHNLKLVSRGNEVPATCTQNGSYDEVSVCVDCKMQIVEHKIIEKLGHDLIHHEAEEAKCGVAGHIAYDTCSRCDYTSYKEIPALEHEYHKDSEVEATYDTDGYETYKCSKCGDTYNKATTLALATEILNFSLVDNEYYTVSGKSTDITGDIVIPSTYNGIPVKSIKKSGFSKCSITSITIPDSVTSIGEDAFYNCVSLKNIYFKVSSIEKYLSIDGLLNIVYDRHLINAKTNDEITEISIPNSITSIESCAFYFCKSITSITIPDSVKKIGRSAFYGTNITFNTYDGASYLGNESNPYYALISYENSSLCDVNDNCKIIADYAFRSSNRLTSITIPEGVTNIGSGAFYGCGSLTSITIPSTVTSIEDSTFYDCSSLKSIKIPNSVTKIGGNAFRSCVALTSITIPDGVTVLENELFGNCFKLANVTIPDSVISIEDSAFMNCFVLNNITIPNSVTKIGGNAFNSCVALTSITIPESVTSLGASVFKNCEFETATVPLDYCSDVKNDKLKTLIITNGEIIDNYKFKDWPALTSITIPNSIKAVYSISSKECPKLTDVYVRIESIEDYLSIVGIESTAGAKHLVNDETNEEITEVVIPNDVTSIKDGAFYRCTSLTSVTINDNVTTINGYTFSYCASLENVKIGSSVTSIGSCAFSYCTSLTSLVIPDNVINIEPRAFLVCSSLENITIGNGVTSIGYQTFESCTSLKSITIPRSIRIVGIAPFLSCSSLKDTYIRIASMSDYISIEGIGEFIGRRHLINDETNEEITEVVIPNGVTSIGSYAFNKCTFITSVTVPKSVTSIGSCAFINCPQLNDTYIRIASIEDYLSIEGNGEYTGTRHLINDETNEEITEVVIPNGVTKICEKAFYSCDALTSITIPKTVTSIGSYAFRNCSQLKDIYIRIASISDYLLINALFEIVVTGHLINDETNEEITEIVIPDDMTSLKDYAFYRFASITSITIPETVTSIGSYAFYNCKSLKTINYSGTLYSWNNIRLGTSWDYGTTDIKVICSDGEKQL